MELKIYIDEIEIDPDLFTEPKKIKSQLEELKYLFPFIVDKIQLLKLKNING